MADMADKVHMGTWRERGQSGESGNKAQGGHKADTWRTSSRNSARFFFLKRVSRLGINDTSIDPKQFLC